LFERCSFFFPHTSAALKLETNHGKNKIKIIIKEVESTVLWSSRDLDSDLDSVSHTEEVGSRESNAFYKDIPFVASYLKRGKPKISKQSLYAQTAKAKPKRVC